MACSKHFVASGCRKPGRIEPDRIGAAGIERKPRLELHGARRDRVPPQHRRRVVAGDGNTKERLPGLVAPAGTRGATAAPVRTGPRRRRRARLRPAGRGVMSRARERSEEGAAGASGYTRRMQKGHEDHEGHEEEPVALLHDLHRLHFSFSAGLHATDQGSTMAVRFRAPSAPRAITIVRCASSRSSCSTPVIDAIRSNAPAVPRHARRDRLRGRERRGRNLHDAVARVRHEQEVLAVLLVDHHVDRLVARAELGHRRAEHFFARLQRRDRELHERRAGVAGDDVWLVGDRVRRRTT